VDRKVSLDEIADVKNMALGDIIEEVEHICYSGTKLNLDYYINQVIDKERQQDIYDYFMSAETDNIASALDEFSNDDVSEEELRLMRIKFLSELAN
jgi:ATP-dependent DNA helicase RecQ